MNIPSYYTLTVWKRQYETLPMITLFAVENSAISGYNRKSDFYQEERKYGRI